MLRLFLLYGSASEFYPSAFFNGMNFDLATYTGGPTYALDNLGLLQSPGANLPACRGFRLATTVADGAVLGPELISSFDFTTWNSLGTTVVTSNSFTTASSGGVSDTLIGVFVAGKKRKITISGETTLAAGSLSFRNTAQTEIYFTSPNKGVFTIELELTVVVGGGLYIRHAGAGTTTISSMSSKEVIPTYVTTDASGNPIVASTPQKTVTYSTDWLSKTFAETFAKFDTSDPLKAPGWLCEPVRTNKVTCRKSNPVDNANFVLSGGTTITVVTESLSNLQSVVDESENIIDISNICNTLNVYEATFPSGASFNVGGTTGNTNKHSMFVVYKMISGGDNVDFGLFGDRARLTTSPSYRVIKKENSTPASSASQLVGVNTSAGTVVLRFILPQLEEGPFCTSPICKAADGSDPLTGLTRSATVSSFPTAGKIPANDFAVRMIVVPRAINATVSYMYSTYSDPNNYTAMYINSSVVLVRKRISGVNTDCTVSIAHAQNVPMQILQIKTSLGMQVAVRTYSGGAWSAWTNGTPNSNDTAKGNSHIGSTYQIGALNGSSQFTGNISLFDCVPIPSGINDPMAWAKTHWGVA